MSHNKSKSAVVRLQATSDDQRNGIKIVFHVTVTKAVCLSI